MILLAIAYYIAVTTHAGIEIVGNFFLAVLLVIIGTYMLLSLIHIFTAEFAAFDPHLVLLDIKLPFYDGYYWCGEIRKLSKVRCV